MAERPLKSADTLQIARAILARNGSALLFQAAHDSIDQAQKLVANATITVSAARTVSTDSHNIRERSARIRTTRVKSVLKCAPVPPAPEVFKVSGHSPTHAVAGAIAKVIRKGFRVVVQAIGAEAVYTSVLAINQARDYLESDGLDLIWAPEFTTRSIDGVDKITVRIHVDRVGASLPPAAPIPRSPRKNSR